MIIFQSLCCRGRTGGSEGKILCLGRWGKTLSPNPARALAIAPVEKGGQARKHWGYSGVWRKILMPGLWGTTWVFSNSSKKITAFHNSWKVTAFPTQQLESCNCFTPPRPSHARTLGCRQPLEPGVWAMTLRTGSVPLGHQYILLPLSPESSLNRKNVTQSVITAGMCQRGWKPWTGKGSGHGPSNLTPASLIPASPSS